MMSPYLRWSSFFEGLNQIFVFLVRFVAGFLYVTLLREHIALLEAQFRLLLICTLIRLIEAAAVLFPPVCGQGRREQHHGVTGPDPQRLRPCCSGRLAGSSLSAWCHCTSLESPVSAEGQMEGKTDTQPPSGTFSWCGAREVRPGISGVMTAMFPFLCFYL